MTEILVREWFNSAGHTLTLPLDFFVRVLYTKGEVSLLHLLGRLRGDLYHRQD